MFIDKTNEVLMNYYRKQEIIKASKRLGEEKMPIVKVLQLANKEFITTDELLEALYISKEQVLEEIINTTQNELENTADVSSNTTSVSKETPMETARKFKKYYEEYNHNREQICKDKKIANGTFQKYLRLNYLIPKVQELVDNKKLAILPAAYISFIDKDYQDIIYHLVQFYDCEITSGVAQRIKEDYLLCKKKNEDYYLNESVIENYKKEKNVKILFTQGEIEKYFSGIPKHSLKEYIISIAKNTHDV